MRIPMLIGQKTFRKAAVFPIILYLVAQANVHAAESNRETPVVQVVRNHAGSVVNISTERTVLLKQHPFWGGYGDAFDQFFEQFSVPQVIGTVNLRSVGSGVIIREDGLIVTNAHVVNMANKIYVVSNDGQTVAGKVLAVSQEDDIALIKINSPRRLKSIQFANPDHMMIGETVVAIGNPFGLENSVSVGVLSGKNRSFSLQGTTLVFKDLVQTDAPINAGNSGGALLNLDGELVGINLAVVQNAQNIGFAISVKKVVQILSAYEQATQTKRVRFPFP